jgi:hypothetical protein
MPRSVPFIAATICFWALWALPLLPTAADEGPPDLTELYRIPPSDRGGRAVKLVYYAEVPVKVFWRFKTDFGADFLTTNKYILSHRLVERRDNTFITETRYTHSSQTSFRWQTTIFPSDLRMTYVLLNPQECGQNFNYGYIEMEAVDRSTRITHTSYFDFFGAFIWAHYPGASGMKSFLRYTARWEKATIKRLLDRYTQR